MSVELRQYLSQVTTQAAKGLAKKTDRGEVIVPRAQVYTPKPFVYDTGKRIAFGSVWRK